MMIYARAAARYTAAPRVEAINPKRQGGTRTCFNLGTVVNRL